jgi:hypothetical protein
MKTLLLPALLIGIWVPFVPQKLGQPVKGIVDSNRAASANETQKSKQNQQSAETEAIQGILAQITQIQQQHAQELKDTESQKNQDADISGKIKNYTFWLVIVGAIQGLILAGTVWAIIHQTSVSKNSERAWVLVDIGKLPPFKPDPNKLEILWVFPTIKNYGKAVARITRVAGIVKLIPEGEKLPIVPEYIVGQGFDEKIDTVLPPEVPLQPRLAIGGDELIEVQKGKRALFVHGFIEYFDGMSKKKRRSAYCFGYTVQAGFSPAETGFYPYLTAPPEYTTCT